MFDISGYKEALTIEEAISFLKENPDAKVIAGGTDLLIKLRDGELGGSILMGISRIAELKEVRKDGDGTVHIGPCVTFTRLEEDETVMSLFPYLGKAGGTMGGPQIRNVATIGGNVCNGATSADSASTLCCLNAQLKLESSEGTRIVPITEFYLGPGRVDLKPGELLTDIMITRENYEGFFGKYIKFSQRNAMDIATLGCAVMVKTRDNVFEEVRIAYGVAAPTPVRCPSAEKVAPGLEVTPENIEKIARTTLEDVHPRDSWRGSKAFREHLVQELAIRAMALSAGMGGADNA